jgi:hypothetical protein
MKIQKIETIRVRFEDGYYCDITPSARTDGFHDFYLSKIGYGNIIFMFGCKIESAEDAAELAEANYEEYVSELETCENDD